MTLTKLPSAWKPWAPQSSECSGRESRWRVAAVCSVALTFVLNAYIALGAVTPSFPFDEVTLLQYAKYFAEGGGQITPVEGAGYFPAWSLVLAPLWWVTSDPAVFYSVVIWVGVLIAVLTVWPLAAAVRRFGLSREQSIVVAALVMCMPSRTVQSDYAMSEKPLFFVLAWLLVASIRLWEKPSASRAVTFALLAALTGLFHSRASVFVIACVIWLAFFALRNVKASLVGLTIAVPLGWFGYRYSMSLNEQLLQGAFKQGLNLTENLSTARPSIILRVILGQSWNQTVASLGLFAVGAVVVLCLIWFEVRRERGIGPACLLGAMFLGIFIVSIASWSSEAALYLDEWRRLDAWIYGRYMEPITAFIVAAGIATVVRGVRPGVLAASGAVSLAIIVPTVYWVAPDAPTWGFITPAHIGGVMPWSGLLPEGDIATWTWGLAPTLTNANRFWAIASVTTLGALAVMAILSNRRVPALVQVIALLGAATVGTVAADPSTDRFQSREGGEPAIAREVRQIEELYGRQEIDYDRSCKPHLVNNAVVQNEVGYWILPSNMDVVFESAELDADIVLSCDDWSEAEVLGAQRTHGASTDGFRVWIMPGELQDQMDSDGKLAAP